MLQLRSATAIIAIVTVAVSAIAILSAALERRASAGFIPARLSGRRACAGALPAWLTPLSSALVHGGWLHLGVNMLMLVCAAPGGADDRPVRLVVRLCSWRRGCGPAQYVVDPSSPVPMVGATGAISAMFGLYALFFGRPKQVLAQPKLNRGDPRRLAPRGLGRPAMDGGILDGRRAMMVATPAHIGGFIAGVVLQQPLLLGDYRKRLALRARDAVHVRLQQPMQMDDHIFHLGIVDRALRRAAPGLLGLRIAVEQANEVDLLRSTKSRPCGSLTRPPKTR